MAMIEVCDLCGRILDPNSPYNQREGLAAIISTGFPQAGPVKVINLRRPNDHQSLCSICAGMLDRCLAFAGVLHRYDQYEHKFYIGLEFAERKNTNGPTITHIIDHTVT